MPPRPPTARQICSLLSSSNCKGVRIYPHPNLVSGTIELGLGRSRGGARGMVNYNPQKMFSFSLSSSLSKRPTHIRSKQRTMSNISNVQKVGDCCKTGKIWSGTRTGKLEIFDEIEAYVARPTSDYDKTKAIIYCPDIFGHKLANAQLLADTFAEETKIPVYAIDYLWGDAIPTEEMDKKERTYSLEAWIERHTVAKTTAILDKFVACLRSQGITTFGATGYCFGAKYSLYLATKKVSSCSVLSHPSLLAIPEDLEALRKSGVSVLFNTCEYDQFFDRHAREETERLWKGVTEDEGYKLDYYPGASHGWVVRGDINNPVVKAAKEKAVITTINWFNKFL